MVEQQTLLKGRDETCQQQTLIAHTHPRGAALLRHGSPSLITLCESTRGDPSVQPAGSVAKTPHVRDSFCVPPFPGSPSWTWHKDPSLTLYCFVFSLLLRGSRRRLRRLPDESFLTKTRKLRVRVSTYTHTIQIILYTRAEETSYMQTKRGEWNGIKLIILLKNFATRVINLFPALTSPTWSVQLLLWALPLFDCFFLDVSSQLVPFCHPGKISSVRLASKERPSVTTVPRLCHNPGQRR